MGEVLKTVKSKAKNFTNVDVSALVKTTPNREAKNNKNAIKSNISEKTSVAVKKQQNEKSESKMTANPSTGKKRLQVNENSKAKSKKPKLEIKSLNKNGDNEISKKALPQKKKNEKIEATLKSSTAKIKNKDVVLDNFEAKQLKMSRKRDKKPEEQLKKEATALSKSMNTGIKETKKKVNTEKPKQPNLVSVKTEGLLKKAKKKKKKPSDTNLEAKGNKAILSKMEQKNSKKTVQQETTLKIKEKKEISKTSGSSETKEKQKKEELLKNTNKASNKEKNISKQKNKVGKKNQATSEPQSSTSNRQVKKAETKNVPKSKKLKKSAVNAKKSTCNAKEESIHVAEGQLNKQNTRKKRIAEDDSNRKSLKTAKLIESDGSNSVSGENSFIGFSSEDNHSNNGYVTNNSSGSADFFGFSDDSATDTSHENSDKVKNVSNKEDNDNKDDDEDNDDDEDDDDEDDDDKDDDGKDEFDKDRKSDNDSDKKDDDSDKKNDDSNNDSNSGSKNNNDTSHNNDNASDYDRNNNEFMDFYGFPENDRLPSDESSTDDTSYVDEDSEFDDETDSYEEETDDYEYDDILDEFYNSDQDTDYEVPKSVQIPLIIHKGTAIKRPLNSEDNIEFDIDACGLQVVELPTETKAVAQNVFTKESLLKICAEFAARTDAEIVKMSDDDSCPELIPIGMERLCSNYENTSSLGSSYEICSSDESFESECVNEKYMETNQKSSAIGRRMKTDVIHAEDCTADIEVKKLKWWKTAENFNYDLPYNDSDNETLRNAEIIEISMPKTFENSVVPSIDSPSTINSSESFDDNLADITVKSNNIVSPMETTNLLSFDQSNDSSRTTSVFLNAINSNHVLVLLKDVIYLYGTLKFKVLAGAVDIYGYAAANIEYYEVFSPRGCISVRIFPIEPKASQNIKEILQKEPIMDNFASRDINKLLKKFSPMKDALLLLKKNIARSAMINMFRKNMNENIFPNMFSFKASRPTLKYEGALGCVFNSTSEKSLVIDDSWWSLNFNEKSKVLLTGGKSVGKSTLLRFLVNRHLSQFKRLLLIDLDIGQPELFVPQTVSCFIITKPLLGPGFFLNEQPFKSYVIGHTNILLCLDTYMTAIEHLLKFCQTEKEFVDIPWLINTMGYNKGFGLNLISNICALLKPTDVVQIQSNKHINNFNEILYPDVISKLAESNLIIESSTARYKADYNLHVIKSAISQESRYQKEWNMSAKDLRYAVILARLSAVLRNENENLTDGAEYVAAFDLSVINLVDPEFNAEQLLSIIDANLVYLCHVEDNTTNPIECIGIGVVRSVNRIAQTINIIPAMPEELLSKVNKLVICEMPMPTSLYLNQGVNKKGPMPFVFNVESDKSSKSVKQIYFRPEKFLGGKHKNVMQER